jgi:uncharacterized protein
MSHANGVAAPVTASAPGAGAAAAIPVTFRNRQGARLFGVYHQVPVPAEPGVALLLLSPGVKMRVAPHRLYNKMADRFVALGYPVLRFDFHGLGDSEGDAPEALLADLYGATQSGRYVDDTLAAMDWLQQEHGCSRFIVGGLCGGALTGLLAATRDARIVSLFAMSMPVIMDGSNVDAGRFITEHQAKGLRGAYLDKLKIWRGDTWRAWGRLLTLQTDFRMVARLLLGPVTRVFRRPAPAGTAATAAAAAPPRDNTNPRFAPALLGMLSSRRRVLLVFAEADRLYWEFQSKFLERHGAAMAGMADRCEIHVTRQANHIFSFAEWQRDMLDVCCQWLRREPTGSARAAD